MSQPISTQKLLELMDLKAQLKALKLAELRLRNEVLDSLAASTMPEGTHNVSIAGIDIKIKRADIYGLDEDTLNDIFDDLSPQERGVVNYRPSLDKRAYKALRTSRLLDKAVTRKPGQANLDISIAGDES